MTSLIERLRGYESWNADTLELMREAADRIEKLESALVHIQRRYTPNGNLAKVCRAALEDDDE